MTITARYTFHISPEDQGQMVEYAYATTGDGRVIRRITDRSDRSVSYAIARMLSGDEGDYWNQAPSNRRWRAMRAEEVR